MTVNLKNFLNPKIKMSKMGEFQELGAIDGLQISSVSADLYGDGRDDLSLFFFEQGANFAAVYTSSSIVSASINWNLRLKRHFIKALFVNTKNANTFTGEKGLLGLKEISKVLSKALTLKAAQTPGGIHDTIKYNEILFASTGVIGEEFPTQKIKNNLNFLVKKLRTVQSKYVWFKTASAIMTTDTRPKLAYEECKIGNKIIKLSGIAKGSGMIAPNMATMLAFVFTDADIPSVYLKALLKRVIGSTFNSITVDGDMSTNDMVGIFATRKAKNPKIYNALDPRLKDFENALHRLSLNLAKQIVVDGEGAKKFITINVVNAKSISMAKNICFSIANSPLFKTAIAGEDANWGRIVMGIGKSQESIAVNKLKIKIGNYSIVDAGQISEDYETQENNIREYMKWGSIDVEVDLKLGEAKHTVYTCDFTHDYIDINADYNRN